MKKQRYSVFAISFFSLLLAFTPSLDTRAQEHATPSTTDSSNSAVEKYNVIDPTRKRLPQRERFQNMLSYEPTAVEKVPFDKLEAIIKSIRAEADKNNHRFALFDLTDACYLRNALFKKELQKSGINLDKSSSSIIIKYFDKNARWSFHSVSVIYTDKGPMVFDPDIKDEDQVLQGNLITPLPTWLEVDWSHMNPTYTMAPPDYVNIDDFLNDKTVFKNVDPSFSFWGNLEGKTPRDPIYQNVVNPAKLDDAAITRHLNSSQRSIHQSDINYRNLKKG
jgi:hypothetical protein